MFPLVRLGVFLYWSRIVNVKSKLTLVTNIDTNVIYVYSNDHSMIFPYVPSSRYPTYPTTSDMCCVNSPQPGDPLSVHVHLSIRQVRVEEDTATLEGIRFHIGWQPWHGGQVWRCQLLQRGTGQINPPKYSSTIYHHAWECRIAVYPGHRSPIYFGNNWCLHCTSWCR